MIAASAPALGAAAGRRCAVRYWGLRALALVGLCALLWWGLDIGVYYAFGPMWEEVTAHSDTPPQFFEAVYELRRARAAATGRGDSTEAAEKEAALDRAAERARRKAAEAAEAGDRLGALVWQAAGLIAADRSPEGTPAPYR